MPTQPQATILIKILKRRPLANLNRFQKQLLGAVLIACFLGYAVCLLCLDYFYFDESSILYDFTWVHLKLLVKWFAPLAAVSLGIVAFIVYFVTHRILGPYERIVRELDEIIEGKHRKLLSVRKHDEMFGDLLKRINTLIKRIPD